MHQFINEKLPKLNIDLGNNISFIHDIKTGEETVTYAVCNLHSGSLSLPISFTYRDSNKYNAFINPVNPSFNQYVLRTKSPTAVVDDFTYVDGSGKQISFKTKYYYTDSADTHIYVSGNLVTGDAEGKLYCTINNIRHEVYVER